MLSRSIAGLVSIVLAALAAPAAAQSRQSAPDIGYVYPAGGQVGTQVTVTMGGQALRDVVEVYVSGRGIAASDLRFDRPLTNREVNVIQDKVERARERLEEAGQTVDMRRREGAVAEFLAILDEMDVSEEDLDKVQEYRQRRRDPKRQLNPQLEQTVTATLDIAEAAALGRREIRVRTLRGLSNPLGFYIGPFPEFLEKEPNDLEAAERIEAPLPVVLNGQIMPGDVDRFRFHAEKRDTLVFKTRARALMPYLADAVPGWFQATLALHDHAGREVAFVDDYRFHPDPVLVYQVPETGEYEVEIRDSIFRGREDFVYRIEVGELPFLKTVFPMGTRLGTPANLQVEGWNLPVDSLQVKRDQTGRHGVSVPDSPRNSNELPFEVDDYPEVTEQEPNNGIESAQVLERPKPPCIVNGRIDAPGDWDVYRFGGRKGGLVTLEVRARRLHSPLDSLLKLTDADGNQIGVNDDAKDPGAGLVTHHADSRLHVKLPETGPYFIHVGDVQNKGGNEFVYRLRVSARRPDFDLRVVPSGINARPGSSVPVTVHVLRRDGFDQEVQLELTAAPAGFELSDGRLSADKDSQEITLSIPASIEAGVYPLELVGSSQPGRGGRIERAAVPADDMMQAFIYRHLVPAEELLVAVSGKAVVRPSGRKDAGSSGDLVRIPHGGTARYQFEVPDRSQLDDVHIELKDPPDGITILRKIRGPGGFVMLLSADAEKTKPGSTGSLKFNVYAERAVPGKGGRAGSKRKVPIGDFPAVPFEITAK